MKEVHGGQNHENNSDGLRTMHAGIARVTYFIMDKGPNLLHLISTFVLLLFISALPSRGDIGLAKSKTIKGTCYINGTALQNFILRICENKEFEKPTEGSRQRKLMNWLDNELDHIQFVQIWTPTPCGPGGYMNCIKPLPTYYTNNFSMHGLWPAAANGNTLQPIGKAKPIRADVFQRVEEKMNIWWANINSRRASHFFWEHEWSKHGVTGNWGEDGAQHYFLDGIKSRQDIDLLSILKSGGIKFNTNYRKDDIVAAIRKWLPVRNIYISCSKQREGSYYLYEIFICLDKVTHTYISCPFDRKPRRCYGEFFQIPHT